MRKPLQINIGNTGVKRLLNLTGMKTNKQYFGFFGLTLITLVLQANVTEAGDGHWVITQLPFQYTEHPTINNSGEVVCATGSGGIFSNVRGELSASGFNPHLANSGEVVYADWFGGPYWDLVSTTRGRLTQGGIIDINASDFDVNATGEVVYIINDTNGYQQVYSTVRGQITFDATDHVNPCINDHGEIVWNQYIDGDGTMAVSSTRGTLPGLCPFLWDLNNAGDFCFSGNIENPPGYYTYPHIFSSVHGVIINDSSQYQWSGGINDAGTIVWTRQAGLFEAQWVVPGQPIIQLNGANPMTNECHTPFNDPGATAYSLPPPPPPLAISAGAYHSLALKTDGTVIGWGLDEFGEIDPPANATNVVAISAGGYQSMALRADGSIVCWGYYDGGIPIPETETDIVAIAAGYSYDLALKADGTVAGWGEYEYGRFQPVTIPDGATNVVAIAAGSAHSLALKADGTVLGWGDDTYGQTDIPANATNLVAISAGAAHSLALKADGTVIAWGTNSFGRLDVPTAATNIVAIAAGGLHSLALRADGKVFAWGWDAAGQTEIPPNATNIVEISAGYYDCLAIVTNGPVLGWGGDYYGQSSIPGGLNTNYLPVTVNGSVNADGPGTYTLTYSATNSQGEVGMATRTVIVVDTTPPSLVCPTNMTVEFSNAAGATVFFTAQATDLCSGTVPVTFVPPSGSTFPIGTNTVVCTATDDSGNTNQCSFTVTVLGPHGVKEDVLAEMLALRATMKARRIPLLDMAIANLTLSVAANSWVDETHLQTKGGEKVFAEEANTVLGLDTFMQQRNNGIAKSVLQGWIDRLTKADRLLAAVEIDAATNAGAAPKQLANALKEIINGDQAAHKQQYSLTILNYQIAWEQAVKLISRLTKKP